MFRFINCWYVAEQKKAQTRPLGEDAYFYNYKYIFVADGVGSWFTHHGVDAGDYARKLVANAQRQIPDETDPQTIMQRAYDNMGDLKGSTTACFASLVVGHQGKFLRVCNVGDSGLMVFRMDPDHNDDFYLVYRTATGDHGNNCPKQLASNPGADFPSDGDVYEWEVFSEDLILCYTDGLSDNLFEHEILRELNTRDHVEKLCEDLVLEAVSTFGDASRITPFSQRNRRFWRGGKPDDVTCVVAIVA